MEDGGRGWRVGEEWRGMEGGWGWRGLRKEGVESWGRMEENREWDGGKGWSVGERMEENGGRGRWRRIEEAEN